ncbi:SDR family NAD(P)-dependent oxidoreductase [Megasphaera elsdenii]|uniref:SDR family NAD(P)-dependent oxidoreductase n=1 Tax=Megasphaera elsdenii TaxID=907 RepID=UPI000916DCC6|nr:SDR family NAD(P)-dependent oxidoreductase [Megasphaera elsdenii]SHK43979.1 NADP-dependent 3-hydroxy acid dehydrogenase YdfG [Megasphaera elsdenii]
MKRTIFVVGTGSGLGNGVARKFAQEGFKVVLMARREEKLAGFTDEFAQEGYEAAKKAVDVTDFSSFAARFAEAVKEHGTPDVLFYNVGITAPDDKEKLDAKTLVEHYIADVAGAYQAVKLVCTEDFGAKAGAILITGGGLALQPYIDYLPLSMDKAALRAMVQALAPSLNEKGIYIGTIQITGRIGSNDHFAPKTIAEKFWELYSKRETNEIVY